MKMQHVSLSDIVPNPWRDMKLYPLDKEHVAELRASIGDHGFFGGIKGRRRNGKVELGCGHGRVEAARAAKLGSIPVFIEDMDDDKMLRLMTDENATQAGANPGAIINEVAAVTRRLIGGLLEGHVQPVHVPPAITVAFADKNAIDVARARLRKRHVDPDAEIPLGFHPIRRYLGQGKEDKCLRGERQVREAITTLKQSGRYDDIVDDALRDHPLPEPSPNELKKAKKTKDVATTKKKKPKRRILDDKCANLFPNDHQFNAFREAVTTPAAQKVIPVESQYELAAQIMASTNEDFRRKQAGAPYIKKMVQNAVEEGMKKQRDVDKAEKEAYMRQQNEERIAGELHSANASLRSLLSSLGRLADLADQFPAHPKIGGFSDRLDTLAAAIREFSKKLNKR